MGFRKLSARPRHHAQNEPAAEAFKKKPPALVADIARRERTDRDLVPR